MKTAWMRVGCVVMVLMAGGYAVGEETDSSVPAPAPATTQAAGDVPALPATQPADGVAATRPARGSNRVNNRADQMLDRMLRSKPGSVRPLQPVPEDEQKTVRQGTKVAPEARDLPLKHEGDIISERVGRLQKAGDWWEFHFESDGRTLGDPPMLVLPNSELARMESAAERARWDLRFRVTGMITAYGGRNYLLVEKVRVVSRADEE